jgi:Cu+-exporting ATPase
MEVPVPTPLTSGSTASNQETICLQIEGMTCAGCAARVQRAIEAVPGVERAEVDLMGRRAFIVLTGDKPADAAGLCQAVAAAGYRAAPLSQSAGSLLEDFTARTAAEKRLWLRRFVVAISALAPVLIIGFVPGMNRDLALAAQAIIGLPAIGFALWPYMQGAWRRLRAGSADMDTLVSLGTGAAAVGGLLQVFYPELLGHSSALIDWFGQHHSYFGEALIILTFVSFGKYLEAAARSRAGNAIVSLLRLVPRTVPVLRGEAVEEVRAEEVQPGQIALVRPGDRIPLDGQILSGMSTVDQSWLTGEPMPVEVGPGDLVYAGTTNVGSGGLRISVLRDAGSTTLAQIIRLAQEAQRQKPRLARAADQLMEYLIPLVLAVAALSFVLWLNLEGLATALATMIAVLVIACPCAIGIAAPMAVMVGIGRGTRGGVLFKGGETIEAAAKVTAVVLDKTGTVTLGRPEVVEIAPAAGVSEEELLRIAAAAERLSGHPFAAAILQGAEQRSISVPVVDHLEVLPGKGVRATLDGRPILVGNDRLFVGTYIDLDPQRETVREMRLRGQTPLWVAYDGRRLGVIAIADPIAPASLEAIQAFKAAGLKVYLLSGDHETAVRAVARQVGIEEICAEVLPDQKVEFVRKLQAAGHRVAMVGDGINDAPALMAADVGIAIGSGADIAIQAADIVLLRPNLQAAVEALRLARATFRTIQENLFWALVYNVTLIPLAAGVLRPWWGIAVPPALAAAAMAASDICVVGNSLRLSWRKT